MEEGMAGQDREVNQEHYCTQPLTPNYQRVPTTVAQVPPTRLSQSPKADSKNGKQAASLYAIQFVNLIDTKLEQPCDGI